jgi:hypothetical protein
MDYKKYILGTDHISESSKRRGAYGYLGTDPRIPCLTPQRQLTCHHPFILTQYSNLLQTIQSTLSLLTVALLTTSNDQSITLSESQ